MTTTSQPKVITIYVADLALAAWLLFVAYLALAHHVYVWTYVWHWAADIIWTITGWAQALISSVTA